MIEDLSRHYFANAALLVCMWPFFWLLGFGLMRPVLASTSERWSAWARLKWSAVAFLVGLIVLLKYAADMRAMHAWSMAPSLDMVLARQFEELFSPRHGQWETTQKIFLELLCRGLSVPLLCAIAVKVWVQWTTPAIGSGPESQRLRLMDLVLAALTAACIAAGTNLNMLPIFIGLAVVMFAWPLINRLSQMNNKGADMSTQTPVELNDERSRVLKLLEDGKITAPDAAELLAALTASHSATSPQPYGPMSLDRKLGFIGAAVVLIAFFLPWVTINLTTELNRFGGVLDRSQLPEEMRNALPTGNITPAAATVTVHGGDAAHGLGWLVLGLAIFAAFVPTMFTHWNALTRRNVRIAAVAAGAIIVAYLLTSAGRWADVGLILAMIGFLIQVGAVVLELRPTWTRSDAQPVVAA